MNMDTVEEETYRVNRLNQLSRVPPIPPPTEQQSNQPAHSLNEVTILLPTRNTSSPQLVPQLHSLPGSRRMTGDNGSLQQELQLSRRPSGILATFRRQSTTGLVAQRRLLMEILQGRTASKSSLNKDEGSHRKRDKEKEHEFRLKNRRAGDGALIDVLSAFYAKILVVLGIAFPVTDILSWRAPTSFYQGFYLYLYVVSVFFVAFMYVAHLRTRALFSMIDSYHDGKKNAILQKSINRYGSFYLRVGAIAFGIGSMVYSGLEFGQFFELKGDSECNNVLIAVTPAARMILSIVQMQFIFLNTKEFELERHKAISRFGLMHMVATNLCEWLYVLVEETKHEIIHLQQHSNHAAEAILEINSTTISHDLTKRATASEIVVECRRTNIMGSLVQNASPFLFPCTIEYSLICAVILFEMWKTLTSSDHHKGHHRKISTVEKGAHHFSVDCSKAHKGMFAGILVIVLAFISLIMFFVLSAEPSYHNLAILEVTIAEVILYASTGSALIFAFLKMRDLKFSRSAKGIPLDCTLLLLAQTGVYIYAMFSIIGCYFAIYYENADEGGVQGLIAEVFSLIQTSLQTIFVLNSWWRRCRSAHQTRVKPGRETVTFLLVSNMAMWFINTLVKNRAAFRPTHLRFFGAWAWTIITHVSMPLAIFYRFHSTICLFEIWKTTYKVRNESHNHSDRSIL